MFRLLLAIASGMVLCRAADGISAQDKKFVTEAAKASMMEVQMGRLGESNSNSDSVKALSKRIDDDHTKAVRELKGLAQQKDIPFPEDRSASTPTPLIGMQGAAFDKAFAKQAVADHQKAIALFQEEAKSGSDPDLKAWANGLVPTLQSHLDAAKALPIK